MRVESRDKKMTAFNKYSKYYDLFYKDKDYKGEAEYVQNLIQKYQPEAKSILDLGCGTGMHDFLLAEKGYEVTGIDMSEEMLAAAEEQIKIKTGLKSSNDNAQTKPLSQPGPLSQSPALTFMHGDIRTVRLNRTFDTVISLFHVMSYQTSNDDLEEAFETVKVHLKPGGIFIFDCWYGPAVLTDRPEVRIKKLADETIAVTRIAEPVMYPNENVVDVNYRIVIEDKATGDLEELNETHRMRYLFKPEIERMLKVEGLELVYCEEWMTGREPGFATWGVCFVVSGSKEKET